MMQLCMQQQWYAMTHLHKHGGSKRQQLKFIAKNINIIMSLSKWENIGVVECYVQETRHFNFKTIHHKLLKVMLMNKWV